MDSAGVETWFGEYLEVFAGCGRGESDTSTLLAYYGIPVIFSTDEVVFYLTSEEQVVAAVQQQVDGLRATNYDHTEILSSDVTVLNANSALFRGEFSRRQHGGEEMDRLTVTYLITTGPSGQRMSAIAIHGA